MGIYLRPSSWKIIISETPGGVIIERAVTCEREAVLPDEISGMPVIGLADHALHPAAWEEKGEVLMIGAEAARDADWNNRMIRRLRLPSAVVSVGDYAFLGMRELTELELCDSVRSWGSGAVSGCRSLSKFVIDRVTGSDAALQYFVREISRETDVFVRDGAQSYRLIFPEYSETYEESLFSQANLFQYFINGAGYPYHHCFTLGKLNLREYDELWPKYMSMGYEDDTAVRLAWWRVRYPVSLEEKAGARYRSFLREHMREAVLFAVREKDAAGLRILFDMADADADVLGAAAQAAREQGSTQILALILEQSHHYGHETAERRFEL